MLSCFQTSWGQPSGAAGEGEWMSPTRLKAAAIARQTAPRLGASLRPGSHSTPRPTGRLVRIKPLPRQRSASKRTTPPGLGARPVNISSIATTMRYAKTGTVARAIAA